MRKKKIVLVSVILFVLCLLSYFGFNIVSKSIQKEQIAENLKVLPDFRFLDLDGSSFTNENLKFNHSTVFIYFNSECDFCQHEAQSISENLFELKDIQLLFVSNEPINIIKDFSEHYELSNQENIYFLHDGNNTFTSHFGANTIPHLLFYNTNKTLIKSHRGQLNAAGILNILND